MSDGTSKGVSKRTVGRPTPGDSSQLLIPEGHPYAGVADGSYIPEGADLKVWRLAMPVVQELLLADFRNRPTLDKRNHLFRRSALSRYLLWLAENEPDLLSSAPLDTDEIRRYLATDTMMRRSSHRSRVALRSILMSFRFDPKKKLPTEPSGSLPPTPDDLFELALNETTHFRSPVTRANARALLLLCRAAGLDGADLRFVRGTDIVKIPGAGTWVVVTNPSAPRRVPVLTRYAGLLEDLGAARGERPMLTADGEIPIDPSNPGQIAGLITRSLKRAGHSGRIQAIGLRKAWIAEHIGANAPLLTLLQAAGLKSLRAFDDLLNEHAPLPSTNSAHIAYELGGLE